MSISLHSITTSFHSNRNMVAFVVVLMVAVLMASVVDAANPRPTGQPTSQPTGNPTSIPTMMPTTEYRAQISFNITLLLHEVNPSTFNSDWDTCEFSIQTTLAQALGIHQSGVVFRQDTVSLYENQIYDYNFADTVINKEFLYGTDGTIDYLSSGRRLSRTHGSRGITLDLTLIANPYNMGFSSSDDAYNAVVDELKATVKTHALTGFLRDQAWLAGCVSVAQVEGITPAFISSSYVAELFNSASPTPSPTHHYVKRMQNRDGVIAGCLIGVTAFIVAVIAASYFQLINFNFGKPLVVDRRLDGIQTVGQPSAEEEPASV